MKRFFLLIALVLAGCGLNKSANKGTRDKTAELRQESSKYLNKYYRVELARLLDAHDVNESILKGLNSRKETLTWNGVEENIPSDEIPAYLDRITEVRKDLGYSYTENRMGATGETFLVYYQLELLGGGDALKIKESLEEMTSRFKDFLACDRGSLCLSQLSFDLSKIALASWPSPG